MFKHDLLVIDLETTGMDFLKNEIIQIAALRIDKDSLEEKDYFETYIKPEHLENAEPEAQKVHGIDYGSLSDKPSFAEAVSLLEAQMPASEVLLSAYNTTFDVPFLTVAYGKAGMKMPYDLHSIDIWGLAYRYWSSGEYEPNPKKRLGFGLSDMAALLGIEATGYHNAATDVRVAAEVLRRLLAKIKLSN